MVKPTEKELDLVEDAFNAVISQEYAEYLQEYGLEHSPDLFDTYYAGASSGLAFIKEWNDNVRKNRSKP